MLPLLLGLAVLLAYLFGAGPSFYWLDSSEFVAAAWDLGVAHPPGHPLAALLGRLFCLLPLGTIGFRVTLSCAVEAAGATALVAVLSGQILRRLPPELKVGPAWVEPLAVAVSSLTLGLSYALWFQAVRAEVYALNLLLLVAGAVLVLRWDEHGDRRLLLLAALLGGLALCNHHFLVILALPAFLLFVVTRRRHRGWRRLALGVVLCGLLGLCTLIYLPLRAANLPRANWGMPTTVERVAWVVSAKAFHTSVDRASAEPLDRRAWGALFAVVGGLGPPAALLALGGFYLLFRRRRTRASAGFVVGVAGLNLLSPLGVGFDAFNPDAYGYLVVALAFVSPGLAVFVRALLGVITDRLAHSVAGRPLAATLALAACALPASQLAQNLPRCDLRSHWATEETARQMLSLPTHTLLFSSYFESVFNLWAVRAVADLRPDVRLVHRNFLGQPGYPEQVAARWPELAPLVQRWAKQQHLDRDSLDRAAARFPVALEYDINVDDSLLPRLWPTGLVMAYGPPLRDPGHRLHRARLARWRRLIGQTTEHETVRAMSWFHYLGLHFACRRGLGDLARIHHGRALELAPESADLRRLAGRCRLVEH